MAGRISYVLRLSSPAQTAALAEQVAPALTPGDCVLLAGPIGAGKTHFARALIQHRLAEAGWSEDVPSPTFTLVQTYDDARAEIWHADLYRLTDPAEIDELGLADAFGSAICLVEWPDRLGDAAPPDALHLSFSAGPREEDRFLHVEADSARWQHVLPVFASQDHVTQT